jgi:hypothetical protein
MVAVVLAVLEEAEALMKAPAVAVLLVRVTAAHPEYLLVVVVVVVEKVVLEAVIQAALRILLL